MTRTATRLHWADYVVFAITLALSCGIGLYYAFTGGKQKTQNEFFLGNRKMRPLPTALSIVVTLLSSVIVLGTPAEIYVHGTQWWMYTVGIMVACVISPLLFIPLLYPLQLTSSYEYLELRFQSKAAKLTGSLLLITSQIFYVAIVTYSPATALESVTGFPAYGSFLCLILVSTFYTTLGGMKAVIWADVFQSIIMIGGMIAIVVVGSLEVGGIKRVWEINEMGNRVTFLDFNPDPTVRQAFWPLVIGGAVAWSARLGVTQTTVQRFSSVSTKRNAYLTIFFAAPGIFVVITLACLCGMVIYANFSDCDPLSQPGPNRLRNPNQLVPYFVMKMLGWPGFPGLFLAVLFSATLSTLSSSFNGMTAVVWEDMLKWKLNSLSETKKSIILKSLVAFFAAVAIGMTFAVEQMGGIVLKTALSFISGAEAPMLGLFVLGGVFPCANWVGAVIGGICGLLFPLWINIGAYVVKPFTPKPPVSIEGCMATLINETFLSATTSSAFINTTSFAIEETLQLIKPIKTLSGISKLYTVSYLWTPAMGTATTVIVGLLVSLVTSPFIHTEEVDPQYLIPIFDRWCCCLPYKWRQICRFRSREKKADSDLYTKNAAWKGSDKAAIINGTAKDDTCEETHL